MSVGRFDKNLISLLLVTPKILSLPRRYVMMFCHVGCIFYNYTKFYIAFINFSANAKMRL